MTQALYRRYRPQTFTDVIGQEHVTEPLQQALASGRVGHAYLFSGPRGCGKTTSARILARCLNCEQGPTPEPCGECGSCVALATGGTGSVDVIEIDAASHGGVDDARDLREKASYGPAQSRYRVFIIDEAHMVTPQGFNALLKIVEEPPEHVKFIFATTEPEKVIGTIRSRTHHYPFRLVPPARLHDYLGQVCEREGATVEPGVLSFVVRAGGGSVRDSLSVLDQLMAGSAGTLTYASAAALLGFTEGELLDATVDAVAARDGAAVFRQIDKVIDTGHDPRRFVEDLLERFRDLIIVSAVGSNTDDSLTAVLRGLPEDQIDRLRQQASAFGAGELSHAADVINSGLSAMTGATAPRLQLELICARLLLPRAAGEEGVIARVDRLERRLEMGGPPPPSAPTAGRAAPVAPAAPRAPEAHEAPTAGAPTATGGEQSAVRGAVVGEVGESAEARPSRSAPQREGRGRFERPQPAQAHGDEPAGRAPEAHEPAGHSADAAVPGAGEAASAPERRPTPGGVDTDAIRRAWPDVLATIFTIRRATWTFLSQHSQVLDYDGERLLLGISSKGLARTFTQGQHAEVVRQALIDSRGVDCRVEGVALDDAQSADSGGGRAAPAPPGGGRAAPAPPSDSERPQGQRQRQRPTAEQRFQNRRDERQHGQAHDAAPEAPRQGNRGGAPRARGAAPGRGDHSHLPPDLPEPPDEDGPPEYDAPPDMYEAPPVERPAERAPQRPAESGPQRSGESRPQGSGESRPPQQRPEAAPAQQAQTAGSADPTGPAGPTGPAAAARPPGPSARGAAGGRRPASGHEAFRAAMAARRAQQRGADETGSSAPAGPPGGAHAPEASRAEDGSPAGSGVSVDDEDISDLSQVGTPVIAEVLGGVVISETEE